MNFCLQGHFSGPFVIGCLASCTAHRPVCIVLASPAQHLARSHYNSPQPHSGTPVADRMAATGVSSAPHRIRPCMQVGGKTSAADRIVGAHFFSPAHIMPLLEIVRTDKTSKQVRAAVSRGMNRPCVCSGILAVHTQV